MCCPMESYPFSAFFLSGFSQPYPLPEPQRNQKHWVCPPSQVVAAVAGGRKRLRCPFFGQKPPFEGSTQLYYGL